MGKWYQDLLSAVLHHTTAKTERANAEPCNQRLIVVQRVKSNPLDDKTNKPCRGVESGEDKCPLTNLALTNQSKTKITPIFLIKMGYNSRCEK